MLRYLDRVQPNMMMIKTLQFIILFLLSCILSGAGGFIATHTSNNNIHVKQQGLQTTTALYDATNDNEQKQLRVIDLPTELEAFEYVDEYDYASYDIFEDADREVVSMEMWAVDNGIQRADCFKLNEEIKGKKEVYAYTNQDVSKGTPVLYVPEHLILSSNKAIAELRTADMEQSEQYVISKDGESQSRQWYLMLKILNEIQLGRDSPWYGWLNSLPRYYENAAAMTDFCLQCLPPLMRKLAEEERDTQRKLSEDTIMKVPFLCDDLKYHPRDFCKWAYQIVYTRAVETEDGDLKIIPLADYFNHGSDYTEIEPYYDEAGNYYAYTSYDVPAGSPLRISYADPRNPAYLLARYGFFDTNCPASYCKLLPPTVDQNMLDLGYSHERMLFYRTGEVADEVWDIFLYLHLGSINPEEQHALMTAHREGDFNTKLALHEKYYSATSTALLEHVDGILEEIDKVIKKSDAHPIYVKNEHRRLPLIHRHNEFVRETFQAVKDRYGGGGW